MAPKSEKKVIIKTKVVTGTPPDQAEAPARLEEKIDASVAQIHRFLEQQAKANSNRDKQFSDKLKEIQDLRSEHTDSEPKNDWLISSYMNEIHNSLREQKNDTARLNSDINDKLKDMLYCLREHKQSDSITFRSLEQKIDTLESTIKDMQLVLFESIQEIKYIKGCSEKSLHEVLKGSSQVSAKSREIQADKANKPQSSKQKPLGDTDGPFTPLPKKVGKQDLAKAPVTSRMFRKLLMMDPDPDSKD